MYQNAPASIAAMTRSSLPLPVMMMAGTGFNSSPSLASRSSPFIPGNSTSAIKTVGANSVKRAKASSALPTPRTSWPHLRRRASYPIRAFSSSSTIRTRSGAGFAVSKRVGSAIQFVSSPCIRGQRLTLNLPAARDSAKLRSHWNAFLPIQCSFPQPLSVPIEAHSPKMNSFQPGQLIILIIM